MEIENIKNFKLEKWIAFGWIICFLIILSSCIPIFANVADDLPAEVEDQTLEDASYETPEIEIYHQEDDEVSLTDEEPPLEEPEPEEEAVEEPWPDRVAFLTFDDGPSWNTATILDILYDAQVPATFFLLGESMIHPNTNELMERILAEGHYIGLHSMTHDFATLYTGVGAADRFVDEMLQLQRIIYDAVGHHTNLCRAPFGMISGFRPDSGHQQAIDEAGIKCVDWNVDPQDWTNTAPLIIEYVVEQTTTLDFPPELVIVLHEQHQTIEALPAIISFLREHGYVFKAYAPGHEFIYTQHR